MVADVRRSSRTQVNQTLLKVSSGVAVVVVMCVVAFVVVILSFNQPVGTLHVTIERLEIAQTEDPWKVMVGTGRQSNYFLMFRRLFVPDPKRSEFKNVRQDQTVYVTAQAFDSNHENCALEFTVYEILKNGRFGLNYEYTPNSNCTLNMTVQWFQSFQ